MFANLWLVIRVFFILFGPDAGNMQPRLGIGITSADYADVTMLGATWYYNWSPDPVAIAGVDAVPLLRGWSPPQPVNGASAHLLLLNEPDDPAQDNMTPEAGAIWWHDAVELNPGRKPVGPNVWRGTDWLIAWRAAHVRLYGVPPQMWALGAHCYRQSATACQDYIGSLVALSQAWGLPGGVWLTEFAFPPCWVGGEERAAAELRTLLDWLDTQPGVQRYAYFTNRMSGDEWWGWGPGCSTALLDDAGLTAFGRVWWEER